MGISTRLPQLLLQRSLCESEKKVHDDKGNTLIYKYISWEGQTFVYNHLDIYSLLLCLCVERKIRTHLDLLSIPQSGGGECQNV